MMNEGIVKQLIVGVFVCLLAAGCGLFGQDSDNSGTSAKAASGEAICRTSCPAMCSSDDDCDTNHGQMCCDFGDGQAACTEPQACPRFCGADDECNTEKGEACCEVSLASERKVCSKPQTCVQFCSKNAECGADEVCCTTYGKSICVAPETCPVDCASSADCKTEEGQICCKNLDDDLASILSVSAVCYPKGMTCWRSCSSSNECDTEAGEICCEGTCAKNCQKKCKENQDCDMGSGQLCCHNPVVQSIWWQGVASTFVYDDGDDCCKYSNPCGWEFDGECDCGGAYDWDWKDCEGGVADVSYWGASDNW